MTVIDRSCLRDATAREPILALLEAGLHAVSPEAAVDRCVTKVGRTLYVTDPMSKRKIERKLGAGRERVLVIGAGKASVRMAARLESVLGSDLAGGIVVAPPGTGSSLHRIRLLVGDHPLPTDASEEAGRELLRYAHSLTEDDFVFCCFSGGASSLIAVPQAGLQPGDLRAVSSVLLTSGVPVDRMNTVRRHLSLIHGGRLGLALHPAQFATLLLSDVADDLPETIASGPTVPDPSTYSEALAIIDRANVRKRLPVSVVRVLEAGRDGRLPETVKPGDPVLRGNPAFLAAGAANAVSAMAAAACAMGIRPIVLRTPLCGDAEVVGRQLGRLAPRLVKRSRLLIAHGETTVIVRGSGQGGRNQQTAAAAALQLSGCKQGRVASFATDGVDGVTTAAGAIVDGQTAGWVRVAGDGLALERALAENDCYPALQASRDLLQTGLTGTNVADLFVVG